MNGQLLEVIEVSHEADRLRCYVAGGEDGCRRVKARLFRGGRVVAENVFVFDTGLTRRELTALVEKAMREVASAAGGRIRILTEAA